MTIEVLKKLAESELFAKVNYLLKKFKNKNKAGCYNDVPTKLFKHRISM